MQSEITIRFAAPDDAEILAELGRETFRDAFIDHPLMPTADLNQYLAENFTLSKITEELFDPAAILLLAEIKREPVGYAKLEPGLRAAGIAGKNPVKLKRLYSKQKFLGHGIGAELMKRCLFEADRRGHDVVWLTVWEHNLRALAFYRKWDFDTHGTIDFSLGSSIMTDFLMRRAV